MRRLAAMSPPVVDQGQKPGETADLRKRVGSHSGLAVEEHAGEPRVPRARGVFLRAVADVERLAGLGPVAREGLVKYLRRRLGVAGAARDDDRLEMGRDAEAVQDFKQPRIEIRDHGEL